MDREYRNINFRRDRIVLFILLVLLGSLFVLVKRSHASDYNQQGQATTITYTILDGTGTPVSGQIVGVSLKRNDDGQYFDWNTGSFTATPTRRMVVMDYDSTDGFYNKKISFDSSSPIYSGDYTVIISNDSSTYKDRVEDCYRFDNLGKLIKIHR